MAPRTRAGRFSRLSSQWCLQSPPRTYSNRQGRPSRTHHPYIRTICKTSPVTTSHAPRPVEMMVRRRQRHRSATHPASRASSTVLDTRSSRRGRCQRPQRRPRCSGAPPAADPIAPSRGRITPTILRKKSWRTRGHTWRSNILRILSRWAMMHSFFGRVTDGD